ncbi:hypothetical protein PUNSTDRAFT_138187 [Punctularia strigosozonata HHB-11173 SS5]|uniref:Uncharacterized protein n=1 Tax=Punctularia strigosozonata (strain HHB-11173) TaxID=741275 RepID=R7S520_PUNST|nr:uncharacterized protein PUNSTDRAFT_138187 [Punctularia strigosozonata HHB-11173 SS5]EIN05004.1 hypothetical protein PUNSTDRAFT_138187 [Punctularia strigosozonata HHB-11173 SS5]
MDKLPPELTTLVCSFACIESASAASTLMRVSKYIRDCTLPHRYRSIALVGPKQMNAFIRHLGMTFNATAAATTGDETTTKTFYEVLVRDQASADRKLLRIERLLVCDVAAEDIFLKRGPDHDRVARAQPGADPLDEFHPWLALLLIVCAPRLADLCLLLLEEGELAYARFLAIVDRVNAFPRMRAFTLCLSKPHELAHAELRPMLDTPMLERLHLIGDSFAVKELARRTPSLTYLRLSAQRPRRELSNRLLRMFRRSVSCWAREERCDNLPPGLRTVFVGIRDLSTFPVREDDREGLYMIKEVSKATLKEGYSEARLILEGPEETREVQLKGILEGWICPWEVAEKVPRVKSAGPATDQILHDTRVWLTLSDNVETQFVSQLWLFVFEFGRRANVGHWAPPSSTVTHLQNVVPACTELPMVHATVLCEDLDCGWTLLPAHERRLRERLRRRLRVHLLHHQSEVTPILPPTLADSPALLGAQHAFVPDSNPGATGTASAGPPPSPSPSAAVLAFDELGLLYPSPLPRSCTSRLPAQPCFACTAPDAQTHEDATRNW